MIYIAIVVTLTIRGHACGQRGGHVLQECTSGTHVFNSSLPAAHTCSCQQYRPHLLNDIDWNHRVKLRRCDVEFSKRS